MIRRLRLAFLASATAAATAGLTMAAPSASAHEEDLLPTICGGSSYFIVNDNGGINGKAKRPLTTAGGARWGFVYLLYSNSTGRNCVVTRKTTWHGTTTRTVAELRVQNVGLFTNAGPFEHYADVQHNAAGNCVQYGGVIYNPNQTVAASGGRFTWGNCGG